MSAFSAIFVFRKNLYSVSRGRIFLLGRSCKLGSRSRCQPPSSPPPPPPPIVHMDFVWINNTTSRFTLVSRSIFFKTRKNYYIPGICKNSKTTPLRMHQKHNRWIHFADTHIIFLSFHMFLWCSFTNNAWSHGINERNQNHCGAKALRILFFLQRRKMQLSVVAAELPHWPYNEP